jgi:hypothetical protein
LSLEQFFSTEDNYLDKDCFDLIENTNMTVPWYLMAAYAYYVEDDPILSDHAYDHMVKKMVKEWEHIEHMHKHLLNLDDLKAGTYLGEYPSRVKGAVRDLRKKKK